MLKSNNYTLGFKELYNIAAPKMKEDIERLRKREPNIHYKEVKFYLFFKVVTVYLGLLMHEVIVKNKIVTLYQRLGYLFPVKSKCTRYIPSRKVFYRDENNKLRMRYEKCNVTKRNLYWFFVFWNSPEKWRHYRFKEKLKWKKLLLKQYDDGMDYLDYTLSKYGLKASNTYSHI
jgi:hypothetical protein